MNVELIVQIIEKIGPIFFLILVGILTRITGLFNEDFINGLKKLVVNLALPSVLFSAFLRIQLEIQYLLIFVLIFGLCIVLFLIGKFVRPLFGKMSAPIPFLFTGFEFGMLGAVFFGTVFGLENFGYIGLIGLGHEFFIWFVYVTLIQKQNGSTLSFIETIKGFIKSPVIIAILLGLLGNLSGIVGVVEENPVFTAFMKSLSYLAAMTVPSILVVIGHGLRFEFRNAFQLFKIIGLRYLAVILLAVVVDQMVFKRLLGLRKIFSAALYTFFLLPPPFIIPLYWDDKQSEEKLFVTQSLALSSIVSLGAFTVFYILFTLW